MMYDINFLDEYKLQQREKRSERLVGTMVAFLALGLALGAFVGNEIRLEKLARLKEELAGRMNDPVFTAQARTAKDRGTELLLLLAYESWLKGLAEHIDNYYSDAGPSIGRVFENARTYVEIERVTIKQGAFHITGYSNDESSVAGYKSSLDAAAYLNNVSVQNIELSDNRYRFSITGISGNGGGRGK